MSKIPATVTVLTRNSAVTLARALDGVKDFDEIIINDAASTDDTRAIANTYGAKIIDQDPQYLREGKVFDFAGVRNQTLKAAKHNWIFWLDSDEQCGADLVSAMKKVIAERGEYGSGVFWINRKYVIDDVVIDCASTYPNRQIRFFAKNAIEGIVKKIHERVKPKEGVKIEIMSGYMYLPTKDDLLSVRRKWDYQISVAVAQVAPLSFGKFLEAVAHCAKVSLLWSFRLIRNALFCNGAKMPLKYELERHYFHYRLLRAYWNVTQFKMH
jgi:glycosyltransferase involved in cell wall biosynthesis